MLHVRRTDKMKAVRDCSTTASTLAKLVERTFPREAASGRALPLVVNTDERDEKYLETLSAALSKHRRVVFADSWVGNATMALLRDGAAPSQRLVPDNYLAFAAIEAVGERASRYAEAGTNNPRCKYLPSPPHRSVCSDVDGISACAWIAS